MRSEIHDAGVEREEQVVAAAVQRKIFDGLFADQAADVAGSGANHGSVTANGNLGSDGTDLQTQVDVGFLADDEIDSGMNSVAKTGLAATHFIFTDGKSEQKVAAEVVRSSGAARTGLKFLALTDAPGTGAPEGSRTIPLMLAEVWA